MLLFNYRLECLTPDEFCSRRLVESGHNKIYSSTSCPKGGSHQVTPCLYDTSSSSKGCEADEPTDYEDPTPPSSGPRVVVVGAGLSGLTAAHRLLSAGLSQLVILEAEPKAGGRTRSEWAEDVVLELGLKGNASAEPAWENPLMKAALCDGLFPQQGPLASPALVSALLQPSLPLSSILRAYALVADVLAEAECNQAPPGYKDIRLEQIGRGLTESERKDIAKVIAALETLSGPKPQVFQDDFGPYIQAAGGTRVAIGESRQLIPLLETIGSERIHYRKEVVNIRWGTVTPDQRPRALLSCKDGSEYPAEYVILTCSLGVLKANMERMFTPPLPNRKVAAISSASFLMDNVAFLAFEDPVWSWASRPINMKFCPKDCVDGTGSYDWTKGIGEMKEVEGSKKVVKFSLAGRAAVEMERASDSMVTEILYNFLKEKTKEKEIPRPAKLIRSKWCDSRTTRGTKSGKTDGWEELAAPLPGTDSPVLLFAGEAISCQGGPLGAQLSAVREAERIISIEKASPKPSLLKYCPRPKVCKPVCHPPK